MLQVAGCDESAGIGGVEAQFAGELEHCAFGLGILAGHEHERRCLRVAGIGHVGGAGGVERLDHAVAAGPSGDQLGAGELWVLSELTGVHSQGVGGVDHHGIAQIQPGECGLHRPPRQRDQNDVCSDHGACHRGDVRPEHRVLRVGWIAHPVHDVVAQRGPAPPER